ncbi:MAG TPA: hypothetical protein VGP36_25940 [Mycobacteriales bacterium]|jgi:hypothetical protein|nr:hypothetical protein [Mycobacteriales bacterium]
MITPPVSWSSRRSASAVLGVDAGSRTAAEAEHLLLGLVADLGAGPGAVLCTHAVRQGTPHYAGTLTLPAPVVLPDVPGAGLALLGAGPDPVGADEPAVGTVPGHRPVAAGVLTAGDPALARTALSAATDRAAGADGRAVRFPGVELLTGTVPVQDVLDRTAVEEVRVLAGGTLPPDALLHTRDFCRPIYQDGRLVLLVLPAGPHAVAPFEVPNPTPCCAVHA